MAGTTTARQVQLERFTLRHDEVCEICAAPILRGEKATYVDSPDGDGVVCGRLCAIALDQFYQRQARQVARDLAAAGWV